MDWKLAGLRLAVATALGLFAANLALAQQSGAYEGGRALGEAMGSLFTKDEDNPVYQQAYREALEREALYWNTVRAKQEADAAERDLKVMGILQKTWIQLGLSPDEARAISGSYKWDSAQDAMILRARNEGYEKTMNAAIGAYKDYQYLQANQLLLAAYLVPVEPDAATP